MKRRSITIAAIACQSTELPPPSASAATKSAATSSGSSLSPAPSLFPQAARSPSPVLGGCGNTQVFAGPGPDAALGLGDNPWASASPVDAGIVAYFWSSPPDLIFAHGPADGTKVLWISHGEHVAHLTIEAHPFNATSPLVRFDFAPALSPSGNYPSGIDLPSVGCWSLELTLGSTHATLDVAVAPAKP